MPTYKKGEKGKYQLVVKKSSWAKLKRKLKQFTKKILPYSFEERLRKLREVWMGWVNNYRLASIHLKLKTLDEWLRNRLRYCIWHDWKKCERKRKNLIRLGIEKGQAYAWSRTSMGGWAVAQSPILRTTITLSRLRRKGYQSMLSFYQKTQPEIRWTAVYENRTYGGVRGAPVGFAHWPSTRLAKFLIVSYKWFVRDF